MRKHHGQIVFAPSDLIVFMESEFASWMDRFNVEFPGEITPDDSDETMLLLQDRGNQHELAYLDALKGEEKRVFEIPRGASEHELTVTAIREGHEIIYQASLARDSFAGRADFLMKKDGASALGDYHYEVWDTKLALKAKPYFVIQLCSYAEMLEVVQGRLPEFVGVVLGDNVTRRFRTADYFYYYRQLKQAFLDFQNGFDRDNQPVPHRAGDCRHWASYAESLLESKDHLSRVASIRLDQIVKLERAGIATLTDLATTSARHVTGMQPGSLSNLKWQARLQLESVGLDQPKYEIVPPNPAEPRKGLALLPPESAKDVFFDMEGYPYIEGGLEYLFGATYLEAGEVRFKDFWAHNREQERRAFADFVDWVHGRWQHDTDMHIYHYAAYEVTALRRLMGRYGTRENEIDDLLRNEVFVDLYKVTRQGVRVGTPSYSIKLIERLFRAKRNTEVATALDSVIFYQSWLEEPDGDTCESSRKLLDIRNYNQDDCESTWKLAGWLRRVQQDNRVQWAPPTPPPSEQSEKAKNRSDVSRLAQEMLDNPPKNIAPEMRPIHELLAHLLEFHWREERPVYWAMFDRAEMTDEELFDDINCLGNLNRTSSPVTPFLRSLLYEYGFDPDQDTKLDEGDKCHLTTDLKIPATIKSLDRDLGRVTIKTTATSLPAHIGLIPNEIVSARPIADSILRTVCRWNESHELQSALQDFLMRRTPRIRGYCGGPIIAPGKAPLAGAIDVIANLDHSTICIQGPPGTGKTWTAARAIKELLARGKTVGVMSNSHKAVCNLMRAVLKIDTSIGHTVKAAKIGGDNDDPLFDEQRVKYIGSVKNLATDKDAPYRLIGGTAWAFCEQVLEGQLDYLFVDEAGQVSVANLVGVAPSTRNIVLVGDQMQLGQPLQGTHPGESGKSTLEYLLGDHQTIPPELGIFLGITYRMHPDLCKLVSGAIYEERLLPAVNTAGRTLAFSSGSGNALQKSCGVLFVAVEHEGNSQDSDEEAACIEQLVADLVVCRISTGDGGATRALTLDDILIVAPYNMQVRNIRRRIQGAKVGSVDKFQGQEAPIVIVSMCASSAESSARGMEFIFNKNRLNVALSRAQTLAIVVGNPQLSLTSCSRIEQMELVNLFCRIIDHGST